MSEFKRHVGLRLVEQLYKEMQKRLIDRDMTFSGWVETKMREELLSCGQTNKIGKEVEASR